VSSGFPAVDQLRQLLRQLREEGKVRTTVG
jgi:hypothetical protein